MQTEVFGFRVDATGSRQYAVGIQYTGKLPLSLIIPTLHLHSLMVIIFAGTRLRRTARVLHPPTFAIRKLSSTHKVGAFQLGCHVWSAGVKLSCVRQRDVLSSFGLIHIRYFV